MKLCLGCRVEPRIDDSHCAACRELPVSRSTSLDLTPTERRQKKLATWAISVFGGLILLAYLASLGGGQPQGRTAPNEPLASTVSQSPSDSFRAAADELGIDAVDYERSAEAYGVDASEALATELVVCREIGECPAGVTRDEAREFVCRTAGNC